MKKKIAVIVIFIFVLVFPMVSWPILFPFDKSEVNENRQPTPFPSFDNEFFINFDKYFTEHIPFRADYIKFYKAFEYMLNNMYGKILDTFGIQYYLSQNNVLFGKEDWLFYLGDNSLEYYQGKNLPSEQDLASMVEKAEKINNYFISKGQEFKIFIAPNKEQIYFEFMPNGIKVVNSSKRLDIIVDYFKKNSNVEIIYPKEELLSNKSNQQLYYKYDTHWNVAGGYYGTLPLLSALGIDYEEGTLSETSCLGGDLTNMIAGEPKKDFEYQLNIRPEIDLKVDFQNESYNCVSSNTNGKKFLLLGDSFRHNMVNVVAKEYTKSNFYHRSNFKDESSFKQEFEEANTIVFQAVERYEWDVFNLIDRFIAFYNL